MPTLVAIDTNVIVRYLVADDKAQAADATELFKAAQSGTVKLLIVSLVIQECVYVLESIYDLEPAAIGPKLISVLSLPNVVAPDANWLIDALQMYRTRQTHFGDALLCAFARMEKCSVATFDKGIAKKFPEVPARTPGGWLSGKAHV